MPRRCMRVVGAVLLFCATLVAQTDQTDEYIKAEMQRQRVPGLSVVVLKDGKIIKAQGYGLADRVRKVPATPETVYKIGSVSKQFIAAGIMLLVQEGRLGLGDPITKYLEGSPPAWNGITIRHLLTQTSGLVREAPGFDPFKIQSDADVIRTAYSVPLRFAPGEKWAYSNVGYFALADIIRTVARRPWTEYLTEKIFKPSGMHATRPTNMRAGVPNLALGYSDNDKLVDASDWPALRPSGAFLSTVLDLAKWDAALYTDSILSEASRRQMWAPATLNDGSSHPYGFGWELGSIKGRRQVHHGGGLPGFISEFTRFVDDRLTVIVLMNLDDADVESIALGVADLYLRAPVSPQAAVHQRRNLCTTGLRLCS